MRLTYPQLIQQPSCIALCAKFANPLSDIQCCSIARICTQSSDTESLFCLSIHTNHRLIRYSVKEKLTDVQIYFRNASWSHVSHGS